MTQLHEQACIRLEAKTQVAYGEDVLIIGSNVNFGSWDMTRAAPMTWEEGDIWVLESELPCGVAVEFKVVVRDQAGGLKWHGAGATGVDNLILETSLGRAGAQGSRFTSVKVPFAMTVKDVDEITHPNAARASSKDSVGHAGHNAGDQQLAVATPAGGPPGKPSEGQLAAILAQQAGGAGRAVTYTTTTVTTTAVTIGADGSPVAPPVNIHPGGPPQQYSPKDGGYSHGATVGGTGMGNHNGNMNGNYNGNMNGGATYVTGNQSGQSYGQDINGTYCNEYSGAMPGGMPGAPIGTPELSDLDEAGLEAAREFNACVPRMGPLALQWPPCNASKVLVQGSWDGWKSPLALEPAPGGGFRILMVLPPGEYQLKFIVDGNWTTSDQMEKTRCDNNENNLVSVSNAALCPVLPKADSAGDALAIEGTLAIENKQLALGN